MYELKFRYDQREYTLFTPGKDDRAAREFAIGRNFVDVELLELIGCLPLDEGAIVDVAAGIGNDTTYYASVLGRKVLALETDPVLGRALEATVEANGIAKAVTIVPARSDQAARAGSGGADGLEIDRVLQTAGLGAIALIRFGDVQDLGAALEGARKTISNGQPVVLVNLDSMADFRVADGALRGHGYRVLYAGGSRRWHVYCPERAADALKPYVDCFVGRQVDENLRYEQQKNRALARDLDKARDEIERLRSLNAGLFTRVSNAEKVALQAKVEMAAVGKAPKVVSVENRARDLKVYKEQYAEAVAESEKWKSLYNSVKNTINEVSLKYRNSTSQVSDMRRQVVDLQEKVTRLESELEQASSREPLSSKTGG